MARPTGREKADIAIAKALDQLAAWTGQQEEIRATAAARRLAIERQEAKRHLAHMTAQRDYWKAAALRYQKTILEVKHEHKQK